MWQTPVGAVAGAMPALLGAAAVGEPLSPIGWGLFGIVFCWQMPHAMAIAWLYRRELADAGIRVAAVVDGSGRIAGRFAFWGAALLLPVSLATFSFLQTRWVCLPDRGCVWAGVFVFFFCILSRQG